MNIDKSQIDTIFDQANQYYQAGQLNEAFDLSVNIIQNDPRHSETAYLLGCIYYDTKDYESAVFSLEYAINANPMPPYYYFLNLGMALREQKKFVEAAKQFEKVMELNPDNAVGYSNLGHIYQRLGKISEAILLYEKSITLLPDYAEGFYCLGTAYDEQKKFDAAADCYLKAHQLEPNNSKLCYYLGHALNYHGCHAEALWCYKRTFLQKKINAGPARIESNQWVKEKCKDLGGKVLSVGAGDDFDKCDSLYRHYFENASAYIRLDVNNEKKPDIVGDIQNLENVVPDESYETVFCYSVFEHVPDIYAAISEVHRVTKSNGKLIATLPLNVGYHAFPHDYHRFTAAGIRQLLKDKFKIIELKPIGEEKELVLDERLTPVGEIGKTGPHGYACMARKI